METKTRIWNVKFLSRKLSLETEKTFEGPISEIAIIKIATATEGYLNNNVKKGGKFRAYSITEINR